MNSGFAVSVAEKNMKMNSEHFHEEEVRLVEAILYLFGWVVIVIGFVGVNCMHVMDNLMHCSVGIILAEDKLTLRSIEDKWFEVDMEEVEYN